MLVTTPADGLGQVTSREVPLPTLAQQIQNGASEPVVAGQGMAEPYVASLVEGWAANTQDTKAAVGVTGLGRDAQTCPPVDL